MAVETVFLKWDLFDDEMFVEFDHDIHWLLSACAEHCKPEIP